MISGSSDTVAVPRNNQQPIFDMAPVPIFWATHAGSTHFEVLGSGGAYAGPLTAFFRYELMGDPAARALVREAPLHPLHGHGLDGADQRHVEVTANAANADERAGGGPAGAPLGDRRMVVSLGGHG